MPNTLKVNIKMYRVGELGDCFLLRFTHKTKVSQVLIDCGSFRNSKKSKDRIASIAKDIQTQLNGKPLDVVVGTHQHNDHLSGYVHAEAIFREIGVEQTWMSWLDDESDPAAAKVQDEHKKLIGLVARLPQAIKAFGVHKKSDAVKQGLDRINDILQFYGAADLEEDDGAPVVPAQGIEILKNIGANPPEFLSPGQVKDLPGLESGAVKVYVLGPPKSYDQIRDISAGAGESYDHNLALATQNAEKFLSALQFKADAAAMGPEQNPFGISEENLDNEHFPFNGNYKIDPKDKENLQWKSFKKTEVHDAYFEPENKWRTIEEDWLAQAEAMALYLNNFTNNSSLVLAFELVKTKKVLLFVGDAQTGNWLSWTGIQWAPGIDAKKTDQLLGNTVFYKVGHHASHNATLVDAFEKMKHPELTAMIPVDKTDPNITKANGWKMPAKNLYKRLIEKTNNKVIRMDDGIAKECVGKNPEWEKKVVVKGLYVELEVKG